MESFLDAIREALSTRAPFDYVRILREHKDAGLTQRAAYEVLEGLRREAPDEATEDRILEVMDIVYGWCGPHQRVWPDAFRP